MDRDSIVEWISRIKSSPAPSSRKRRSSFASPPPSQKEGEGDMTSTPQKRRRFVNPGESFDPDTTPRPNSVSFSTSQISSRNSSTKAQLASLQMNDLVRCVPLSQETAPLAVNTIFKTMKKIEDGIGTLPNNYKKIFMDKENLDEEDFQVWAAHFKSDDEPDDLPGRLPSITELEYLEERTVECTNHDEFGWNDLVHLPLLRLIFEDHHHKRCDDFNAITLTTARAHQAFKPFGALGKMIDLGIYSVLDQNPELIAALKAFGQTTLTRTVNHTNYIGLQLNPLLISIETKLPGEGFKEAKLQMGVWHAAQWAFLEWAIKRKLHQQHLDQNLDIPTDEFKPEALEVLAKLAYIPGIFISGEYWSYVVSTYNNGKTILYTRGKMFGGTGSMEEIFRAIAGIRELTAWGRDQYLPWFQKNILTLESQMEVAK